MNGDGKMDYIYYVQKQAEYYKRMIIPIAATFNVHSEFMFGLSQEEWVDEFKRFHTVMKSIYDDVCDDPISYGLPLYEAEKYHTHSKEARESLASVWRIGNILYCLSMSGEIVNGDLYVNIKKFDNMLSEMKVKNKAYIINSLIRQGFYFSNWDKNKFSEGSDQFVVSYPEASRFLAMLKGYCTRASYSLKGTKGYVNTHFYILNYRAMEEKTDTLPDLELTDFENLIGEENTKFFRAFLEYIKKYDYSIGIEEDIIYKATFFNHKGKDTGDYFRLTDYHYTQDGLLKLRLKLNNIEKYIHKCQWPEAIKESLLSATPCRHCKEECVMRLSFVFDGVEKDACRCEGDVFSFFSPKIEHLHYYQKLFDFEKECLIK